MPLLTFPAEPWPREGGWLVPGDNCSPLGYKIVMRAFKDIGIEEDPEGSNRGVRIDRYAKRGGSPVGSYWCALWAGAVFVDCGCKVPNSYGLTDNWLPYITDTPAVGSAILYGLRKKGPVRADMDSHHIGIIVRLTPKMRTIEGNRSWAGTASNNGQAVDIGPVMRKDILGFFHPQSA